jgi:hypothetical protein
VLSPISLESPSKHWKKTKPFANSLIGKEIGLVAITTGQRPCDIAGFHGSAAEKLFFDVAVLGQTLKKKGKSVREKIGDNEYG